MPIYQYLCNECGHQADYLVRTVGEVPVGCMECSSTDLLKVLHGQIFGIGRSKANERSQQPIPSSIGEPVAVIFLDIIVQRSAKEYKDMN